MICNSFDQVIHDLILKISKEKPIFSFFSFFSLRKTPSHMIFPFLELLKHSLQLFKKSPDHNHMTKITWFWECFTKQSDDVATSFFLSTTTTSPNPSVLFAIWVISYLLSAGALLNSDIHLLSAGASVSVSWTVGCLSGFLIGCFASLC